MVKTVRQSPEPGSKGQQHQQEGQVLPFLQAHHKTEGMFFHQASADQFVVHGTHAPAPGGTAAELLHPFLRIKFIIRGPAALMDDHTVFFHEFPATAHHDVRIILFSGAKQAREHPPVHPVIRVHKAHVFSLRGIQPGIPGRGHSGVGLADNPEAIVFFPPPVQKLQRPVRGAVIHADDFHGTQRLLRQAGHAFVHVGRYVVTGDNDGNGSFHDNPDNRSLRRWYRPFLPLHADIRVL